METGRVFDKARSGRKRVSKENHLGVFLVTNRTHEDNLSINVKKNTSKKKKPFNIYS